MIIRLIQHGTEDYDQMIRLRLEVLLSPVGIPESYIRKEKEKTDFLIGAFDDERMIGSCVLTPLSDTTLQLRQMAVRQEQQGKNIGRAILTFAERVAKDKGFEVVMMHARDVAIRFYEKAGYKIFDQPFEEVGIAHVKMNKNLKQTQASRDR